MYFTKTIIITKMSTTMLDTNTLLGIGSHVIYTEKNSKHKVEGCLWRQFIRILVFAEGNFEAFPAPGPKPLPERFIFIAREPFFGLDRISGF